MLQTPLVRTVLNGSLEGLRRMINKKNPPKLPYYYVQHISNMGEDWVEEHGLFL